MTAYYNEIDPYAAAWLRNLIAAGHIAPGDVDDRSILDVRPYDLRNYTQCHFFAGIGGWSHALRLAGWPDDRPVWTGSCPCQPFSAAGKGKGADDERHLWPAWFNLIRECRPDTIFGEQVAAAVGHGWLDLVSSDLEGQGYAVGACVLGAHSVGAPHIRQRLWFVAHHHHQGSQGRVFGRDRSDERPAGQSGVGGEGVGNSECGGPQGGDERLAAQGAILPTEGGSLEQPEGQQVGVPGRAWINGATDWLPCRDGKWRPTQPGLFPLAHGVPGRVGRLRAYGNALVPQVAAEVIGAFVTYVERPSD